MYAIKWDCPLFLMPYRQPEYQNLLNLTANRDLTRQLVLDNFTLLVTNDETKLLVKKMLNSLSDFKQVTYS